MLTKHRSAFSDIELKWRYLSNKVHHNAGIDFCMRSDLEHKLLYYKNKQLKALKWTPDRYVACRLLNHKKWTSHQVVPAGHSPQRCGLLIPNNKQV